MWSRLRTCGIQVVSWSKLGGDLGTVSELELTSVHPIHGLAGTERLRSEVFSAQAEILLEEATALMIRSAYELADQVNHRLPRTLHPTAELTFRLYGKQLA